MKINGSKKQRGAVMPFVTIVLPLLLFAAGWALDFGHVFVDKTRLQNALDATALSAAIAINMDVNKSTSAATSKGIETFNQFKAALGNNELAGLNGGSLVFEYSKTLVPFSPGTNPPAFVRVTSTNMLAVRPALLRILSAFSSNITVPAVATAGPVGQNCTLMPFFLCADMSPLDTDCSDGACYGYTLGQIYFLDMAGKNNYTAGNFGLLNLTGNGANQIKQDLQGNAVNTCQNPGLNTQTGLTWGPVRDGINYRIDTLDTNHNDYFTTTAYTDYVAAGGNYSRVIAVPFGDCTSMKTGNATLPKVGTGCVFITQHAAQGTPQTVDIQFIGSCQQNGAWNPNNPVLNGPYKIVLYKSPGSVDS